MAASEHTPHMQLSQFGPDDRPSWIDDYNQDMRTIDTAVSGAQNEATEANQNAARNSQEIQKIKDGLGNIGLPFNFFQYTGRDKLSSSPITSSGSGVGDNDIIQSIDRKKLMRVNSDGIYIIWSNIRTTIFGNVSDKATVRAGVYVYNPAPSMGGTEFTMLVTRPLTSGTEYSTDDVVQTFHLPPTVIRMEAGSQFSVKFNVKDADGREDSENAYQKYASVGVVKIG